MVNKAQSWKALKALVDKIPDNTVRNVVMAELRGRAIRDWGFNPDRRFGVVKTETIELNDWETDLVADISKHRQYQLDTREKKRERELKEARARMRMLIDSGGSLADIPAEICTPFIKKLYFDTLLGMIKENVAIL